MNRTHLHRIGGSARLLFLVAVAGILTCDWTTEPENRAPHRVGTIPDQVVVVVDSSVVLDVTALFADPEGDALAYTAGSADPATAEATVSGGMLTVTGAAPGETTVTVNARDPGGLTATLSFGVTVPNRAPVVSDLIGDREVQVDSTLVINAAAHFRDPDGQDLSYAATSSDPARATAAVSGSTLSLTGVARGTTTVTVTVRDPGGLEAGQSFEVTVPNRAPESVGRIGDRVVEVDSVRVLDVAPFFSDPDGDALAYAAVSSDSARVVVAVAGSEVTVNGVAKGMAAVTVVARDQGGLEAGQSFGVTVPNRAPEPVGKIGDRELHVGDEVEVDVAGHFSDPDGDALEYAAVSSDTSRAVTGVAEGVVTVTGVAVGDATVRVTARDPEGLAAEQEFKVTLPNRAPEPRGTIAARELHVGDSVAVDVAAYFAEPDGEALAYAATSSDTTRVVVATTGSTLSVTGVGVGAATVTVTARDTGGLEAEQRFAVTVPNRAPAAIGTITGRVVQADSSVTVDVAAYFTDPDGHDLAYAATSSDSTRARVAASGSVITVTGVSGGKATVTVTARDSGGLSASQRFDVTVPNQAPGPVGTIGDRAVEVDRSLSLDVAPYFRDPDGDDLMYAATSASPATATVRATGSNVTATGRRAGTVTITVSATDPGGLIATQSFRLRVVQGNRKPRLVGAIPDATLGAGSALSVDVSSYFDDPDGDDLDFGASSSDPSSATVILAGATLTVVAEAEGFATITVTATDPGHLTATQQFDVTVDAQRPVDPPPPGDLAVGTPSANPDVLGPGESFTLTASVHNQGETGTSSRTTLRYYHSADATIGTADTEIGTDTVPRLAPSRSSTQSIPVTAPSAPGTYHYGACVDALDDEADSANNCSSAVEVRVATESAGQPDLVVRFPAADPARVEPGGSFTLSAAVHNRGAGGAPSGTTLRYYSSTDATITSSDSEIGTDAVPRLAASGTSTQSLTVTAPFSLGPYYYGACADALDSETDTGNNCSSAATVEVVPPNQTPRTVGTIPDHTADVNDQVSIDVEPYFTDPDGDDLTYTATSTNTAVLSSTVSGSSVEFTALAEGEATVQVTATDPGGLSATQSFKVTVIDIPNNAPVVSNPIDDIVDASPTETFSMDLLDVFTDPDDDVLSWETSSSDNFVAGSWTLDNTLRVRARRDGTTTVTVTATDPEGLSVADTFEVTVVPDRFEIDLYATSDFTDSQLSEIQDARDHWEAILAQTELPNTTLHSRSLCLLNDVSYPITIDDHAVRVDVSEIDGPGGLIALAYFCDTGGDGIPVASAAFFDEDDIARTELAGDLFDVAFHEFAHGLGFSNGYFEDHGKLDTGTDPHFTGALAIEAFDSAGGTSYTGAKVPVAPDYSHWREDVLGTETMTPTINFAGANPISAITLQAMADLGYTVDVSLADDYDLPGAVPPDVGADTAARVYDLSGDVLRVPVRVIEADGRIVRVIPAPEGWVLPASSGPAVLIDRRGEGGPGRWVRIPSRRDSPGR